MLRRCLAHGFLGKCSAALLLLLVWALPALAQHSPLAPGLQSTLDALGPFETTEVVVTFNQNGPVTLAQRTALLQMGIAQGIYMQNLPIIGVVATANQVAALAQRSDVRSIWPNEEVTYFNAEGREITGVNAVRTDNDFRIQNGGLPVSGRGVGVVVHDSGIDATHDDLEYGSHVVQNVQGLTNLSAVSGLLPRTATEGQINTDIGSGHGTHVAGTVGGTGARSGGLYEGMAPGADLVGYGSGAVILILDTIGGFDYAITHQSEYNIRVITNSWGGAGAFDPNHPVNVASYATYKRGITVLFAAGNDGPGAGTLTRYAAPWVITVAAGNKDGATLTDFSSRGTAGEMLDFTQPDGTSWTFHSEPTLTAPGNDIVSTNATTGALGTPPLDPAYAAFYVQMDGTSMATPHVAGIVALMLEANPSLQPLDVIQTLKATATPMDYEAWEAGAGYVNAYAAVASAFGYDPTGYLKCGFLCSDDDGMTDDGTLLTDEEGDASQVGTDITAVTLHDVAADGFQLTLHVADLAEATPSTMMAAGLQVGAMQEYEVEFDLMREGLSTVRYSVSAKQTLVDAGAAGVTLSGASFDYGIRATDGAGRGLGDLSGTWDAEAGTITYEIPFSIMNVHTPPADLTADIDRTGRTPVEGDIMTAFGATVNTSFWGGVVGLTPGQTNWDGANGTASYTIGDEVEGDDGTGDGNDDGGDDTSGGTTGGSAPPADDAQVVVAVIDSGINPYHEFFRAGGEPYATNAPSSVTQEILDAFDIGQDQILNLTDYDSDTALWSNVETGKYYWFAGTNIIARSYDPGNRVILPDDNDDTHGVGTSAAVVRANPEAVVVFYEGITDASEAEAFNHPAIDIVSTSYGPIGSIPLPSHINNSYIGVVENGKLHFGASDNSPSTAIQDGTAGPWWSIGVNGYQEGTAEGKQIMSGSVADFAADFTQSLPYCDVCTSGMQNVSGTSFATPRSAGTASLVVLEARREVGHMGGIGEISGVKVLANGTTAITNWQLRRAMEESAYYPGVADYEPAGGPSTYDLTAIPVLDEAPYTLVGWGVLRPEADFGVVSQTLAHLGLGSETVTRTKSYEACTFQTTLISSRHAYWDMISAEATGEDPYLYCGFNAFKGAGDEAASADLPQQFELSQNYPNPFNPTTAIRFALPAKTQARLAVYNALGQEVALLVDGAILDAGQHTATFDAAHLASGTYLYRLEAGGQVITRQMVLMK